MGTLQRRAQGALGRGGAPRFPLLSVPSRISARLMVPGLLPGRGAAVPGNGGSGICSCPAQRLPSPILWLDGHQTSPLGWNWELFIWCEGYRPGPAPLRFLAGAGGQ